MLTKEKRESAMAKAVEMAALDLKTNGAYANAPYTIITLEGVHLKARVRHSENQDNHMVRLELYQPETYVSSHELDRKPKSK